VYNGAASATTIQHRPNAFCGKYRSDIILKRIRIPTLSLRIKPVQFFGYEQFTNLESDGGFRGCRRSTFYLMITLNDYLNIVVMPHVLLNNLYLNDHMR